MSEPFSTTVARLSKQALEHPETAVKVLTTLSKAADQIETARYSREMKGGRLLAPDYLAYIRKKACVICGKSPCEPHHFGRSGVGKKSHDYETVPLCTAHHRIFHTVGCNENQRLEFAKAALGYLIEYFTQERT